MKYKVFVAVFFLCCAFPLVTAWMPKVHSGDGNEVPPSVSVKTEEGKLNLELFSDFSHYFDKQFGFREEMITGYNQLNTFLFRESNEPKVIVGKDGFLFYTETLSDYQGTNLLSDQELDQIVENLSKVDAYCRENGIDFVFTIAPNKNSLYPEFMPKRYRKSEEESNRERLKKRLENTSVCYVDLYKPFSEADHVLYRKTDSHWSDEGAGLAADLILSTIEKPNRTSYFGSETKVVHEENGDLFQMIYPAAKDPAGDVQYTKDFDFSYAAPIHSTMDMTIKTECTGKEQKLFMFRDSFGISLHKFMANEFAECCFSRALPYNMSLVAEYQPDVVVIEIVERNLIELAEKEPIIPTE